MPIPRQLSILRAEKALAGAHLQLLRAENAARDAGRDDLGDELAFMHAELRQMNSDLLKRSRSLRSRTADRAYLYPSLLDDGRPST